MGGRLTVYPVRWRHLLSLLIVFALPAFAGWYEKEETIMGTSVSVKLWHPDANKAEQIMADVMAEMRRIDASLSPFIETSELSRVNRTAARAPVPVSRELATIVDKALWFSERSQGAFDITFASVGHLYDYRKQQQPDEQQRQALLDAIDYHLIELDRDKSTLFFKDPRVQIDLGGIAKGYAVDRGAAILRRHSVEHGTVNAGGDSRILGDKRGEPWIIGIKKPRGQRGDSPRDQAAIMLPLSDTAISTSGDYERYFIDTASGRRVHHIINPDTGQSATGVVSVSVLGPGGFDTDPLSTTVFVLGVEQGLSLINRLPGFDCVIIDSRGQVHYSDGLAPPVKPDQK